MDKLIITFQVFIDDFQVFNMKEPYGVVSFIPFTGKVQFFVTEFGSNGEITRCRQK